MGGDRRAWLSTSVQQEKNTMFGWVVTEENEKATSRVAVGNVLQQMCSQHALTARESEKISKLFPQYAMPRVVVRHIEVESATRIESFARLNEIIESVDGQQSRSIRSGTLWYRVKPSIVLAPVHRFTFAMLAALCGSKNGHELNARVHVDVILDGGEDKIDHEDAELEIRVPKANALEAIETHVFHCVDRAVRRQHEPQALLKEKTPAQRFAALLWAFSGQDRALRKLGTSTMRLVDESITERRLTGELDDVL